MSDVKVEVAEFTDKVTGKVSEYHFVSKADYDALAAELDHTRMSLNDQREKAAHLESALTLLTNGMKYSAEVCVIAREALGETK